MRIIESGYSRNIIRQEGFYLDSTVQTVQEVGSQVSQYKQMFEKEKMGIGYRVNVFRNVVCPSAKNCAKMSKEDFVREGYD